jgi:glycine betaine catabolism B
MEIPVQEFGLKITEIIDEAPEVKTFRVKIPDSTELKFYPGQFFMVNFGENPNFKRAYSIASSPLNKKYLDITMNVVGEFTKKLWLAKIGDCLIFKGPYGKFYFSEDIENDLVLIGGGLGITPLMSIIRYCYDKKLANKINLIYSVRTPTDIVYKEELDKIKSENRNFDYKVTVTRPAFGPKWEGRTGRIDEGLLKQHIENVEKSLHFICGPMEFVKSNIAILGGLGARREQIKTDIWG